MWLSSQGRILWHPPEQSEIITFEERTLPDIGDPLEERVRDFETVEDAEWKRFYHGVFEEEMHDPDSSLRVPASGAERGFPADPEVEDPRDEEGEAAEYIGIHSTMKCEHDEQMARGMFYEGDKYFVVPWRDIEEEVMMEEESKVFVSHSTVVEDISEEDVSRLEGDGSVPISPQEIEKMTGAEREKWIKAITDELGSLVEVDVKLDVTNQDLQRN